ncbi:DUF1822 family protein [Acaryochloris sp. CCMEE 5410]|uniref:DUF1822 family protein n=1 Tax=Acaryochloris sp. CCMEE 5410 TaxID=310037 RepID=UPI000248436C|nr:DUF1822 family protein [Acaryochloris sp. CCMEE 5410]KAI9132086.1 DUF1822 family protein [Acaryochloris sp. CCMEE 5410]
MTIVPTPPDLAADFTALPITAITLSEMQISEVIQQSESLPEAWQWRGYLHGLALTALESWLAERSYLGVRVRPFLDPTYLPFCDASYLQVGEWRVAVLVSGLTDAEVAIPRAALEVAGFVPHCFVKVEVLEELAQVEIQGGLRWDDAVQLLPSLIPQPDWTYALSPQAFVPANELLLWLRCLETVPQLELQSHISTTLTESLLIEKLDHVRSGAEFWQSFTWHEAASILSNAECLSRCSEYWQHEPTQDSIDSVTEPERAIDVGAWLQQRLDDAARQFSWILMPPLATALRSTDPVIVAVIGELQRQGMDIPTSAGGAYRDLTLGLSQLRLYSIVWPVEPNLSNTEWTLLVVVGAKPETTLEQTVKLLVSDTEKVLADPMLTPTEEDICIYAQVVGEFEEQFWVTLSAADSRSPAATLRLSPFKFASNKNS